MVSVHESEWCSIIPFRGNCEVKSTGLLYNMDNLNLEFGKLISTSNAFDPNEKKVTLTISRDALWSQHLILE